MAEILEKVNLHWQSFLHCCRAVTPVPVPLTNPPMPPQTKTSMSKADFWPVLSLFFQMVKYYLKISLPINYFPF
jgi:hypothetical protein